MVNIGILGANGRMGRVMVEAINENEQATIGAAMVRRGSRWCGVDVGELAGTGTAGLEITDNPNADELDVVIDFTLPEALSTHLDWCVKHQKPLVIGTTGLNEEQKQAVSKASKSIPVVLSANMSIGVNLLFNLLRQTARVMGESADIEIWEAHHRFKQDAPSGTAVAMGEAIADELLWDFPECAVYTREGFTGERERKTIGFASTRAGDIVGEHTAMFADIGERIEITHRASSRLTFARGAVRAALWLADKTAGQYDMQQVLGLD